MLKILSFLFVTAGIVAAIYYGWQVLQRQFNSMLVQLDKKLFETMSQTRVELSQKVDDFNLKAEQRISLIARQVDDFNLKAEQRMGSIASQVENKLQHGFEKTNATFVDIVQRLTMIDEAQKKISELSSSVVSLKEVLADKSARGAFGEVQLHTLIKNVLPAHTYALQHTLKNGTRADCILYLPAPSGHVVIDSKFPLEDYQVSVLPDIDDHRRKTAQKQFGQAVKKHINDIADKYIIPGETSDGAVMFIPAEAVFSEIHAHYPDIVAYAHQKRVWLTSPTTMMAVLTTAHSVLKDAATRQQVHLIQEHLRMLGQDFGRFEKRMDNLKRHLQQANQDAEQVHISAKRINSRFKKIEKVDLPEAQADATASILTASIENDG